MKQMIKYITFSFVLLSSFFAFDIVNALVKDQTWPIINSFTFDQVVQCNLIRRYYYVEGSEYIVPMPKESDNFLYWYNHSDNKIYNPSDIIEVDSGMYLEAFYE